MKRSVTLAAVASMLAATTLADEPPKIQEQPPETLKQEQLDKQFQKAMLPATLVGHFTERAKEQGVLPKPERYTIESVSKLPGDYWLFKTRIQYGEHDVTLPLPLRVLWAGNTPVITLDKVPVPGFGIFTARVMIFDDQYAGTWEGGDHGGHLFGRIERDKK